MTRALHAEHKCDTKKAPLDTAKPEHAGQPATRSATSRVAWSPAARQGPTLDHSALHPETCRGRETTDEDFEGTFEANGQQVLQPVLRN